jgi:two-component sensor histidine kinase
MTDPLPQPDTPSAAIVETLETRLQAAYDREIVLRGELQHRVRNMLAVLRSIFDRTVVAGGSLEEVTSHFRGRLDAVAQFQSARVAQPGAAVDLEQIIRDEMHSFQFGDHPKISIDGPETALNPDAAQLLRLAVHELVTNSLKFGVLSADGGGAQLHVRWTTDIDRLAFTWVETGVSVIASAPIRRGFGREFIEQALPYQLGATTIFELRPGGVFCFIELPLGPMRVHYAS